MISERFLEWFDTLEVKEKQTSTPRKGSKRGSRSGSRAKSAQCYEKVSSKKGLKRSLSKTHDVSTLLPILGPRPEGEVRTPKNEVRAPPIPRVATLCKNQKKKVIGLGDTRKNYFNLSQDRLKPKKLEKILKVKHEKQADYEYSNNAPGPGLCTLSLLTDPRIPLAPTLIFTSETIQWFGVEGQRLEFESVKALSSHYKTIVEGLLYFLSKLQKASPVALVKIEGQKKSTAIFSRNDLVTQIERLCKHFTLKTLRSLSAIQAFVPSDMEPVRAVWKSEFERQHAGDKDKGNRGYFLLASKVSRNLSSPTHIYSELVCDFRKDTSKKTWLINIKHYRQQPRPVETSPRNDRKNKVKKGTKKQKSDNLKRPSWCIGEFCSKEGCEDETTKYTIVYKTILQYRMNLSSVTELNKVLPSNERRRLFETIKVCKTCSEKFNNFALEQSERELEIKRNKQKADKKRKKKADEENEYAKESEAERIQRIEKLAEKIEKQEAKILENSRKLMMEKKGMNKLAQVSTKLAVSTKTEKKEKPKTRETLHIYGLNCTDFFGNDAAKLLLCTRIMDLLQKKKNVKLHASVAENNNSDDESRLVLRSVYLEFRGLCADLGFFPDVPIEGGEAVMTLKAKE